MDDWVNKVGVWELGDERGVNICPGDTEHRVSEDYMISVYLSSTVKDNECCPYSTPLGFS